MQNIQNNETTKRVNEEHRKRNRYWLGVPVVFSWQDTRHAQHKGIGLTRDIATNSVFVLTATPPRLKAKTELKVFLPPVGRAGVPMRLHGEGTVVRVEAIKHHHALRGFAVVGKPFVLRRGVIRR